MSSKEDKPEMKEEEEETTGPGAESVEDGLVRKFLDFDDFNQFYDNLSKTLKETVAASSKIPIRSNELDYYMTFPSFKSFVTQQNDRILKLIGNLLKQQNFKKTTNIASSRLDDDERMDLLTDANDQIIEKLGIQLDEIQGLRKKTETELKLSVTSLHTTTRNIKTSWNKNMGMVVARPSADASASSSAAEPGRAADASGGGPDARVDITKKTVQQKPQKAFQDKVDNSLVPFVPKLRTKPNALRELPEIHSKLNDPAIKIDQELFEKFPELLENPYTYEIEQFDPPQEALEEPKDPLTPPPSLEQTPFKYIDTVEELVELCEQLGKSNRARVKEIAVDLEHHSYRSFLGFTCLMQISTRTHDYVVDTIKLRAEMHRLNEVFTDFTLLKVFHGADFDVEWLQKDFGIYVVNMFDTGQATRVLQHPHHSLSYLLQHFCQVTAQKQYQLADWRTRPLGEAMLKYAREDTHYLLYIYDRLRGELLAKGQSQPGGPASLLRQVYENSKMICKKTYRKPQFYSKGFQMLCQNNQHLNHKQAKALKELYAWRDRMAREADESCDYVLKNHQLLKIAELLPREVHGILALCNPISTMLEASVHELHDIVKNAREYRGVVGTAPAPPASDSQASFVPNLKAQSAQLPLEPDMGFLNLPKSSTALDSIVHSNTYDPDSILNCPHDRVHHSEEHHEEAMQTDQQISNIEDVSRVDLKDLLIKPGRLSGQNEAAEARLIGLVPTDSNPLGDLLRKDTARLSLVPKSQKKGLKKVEEKVLAIKESIRNPFEMFLPAEFRTAGQSSSEDEGAATAAPLRWNLLKPASAPTATIYVKPMPVVEEVVLAKDSTMIPLKQMQRLEKQQQGGKKMNKQVLKNVDFTDAIIEYNRSKAEASKVVALGGDGEDGGKIEALQGEEEDVEESNENNNLMAQQIRAGLRTLAQSAKEEPRPQTSSATPFSYDDQSINSLFTKARGKLDESKKAGNARSGGKKSSNGASNLHKKRITNSVTRFKNNKSMTYKPS